MNDVPQGAGRKTIRPPTATQGTQEPQAPAETQSTKTTSASLLEFDWVTIIAVIGFCALAGFALYVGKDQIALAIVAAIAAWVNRLYK
jgi:hypothetical protein